MAWAILDSSIYVGHWERGLYDDLLAAVRREVVVRHSAVVVSELRRGARTRHAQALLASLLDRATTRWDPTVPDGGEAGLLIRAHWLLAWALLAAAASALGFILAAGTKPGTGSSS